MAKKSNELKKAQKKPAPPGRYAYKPIVSAIVVCSCGGKYVKTRIDQMTCVRCINEK